MPSCRDCENTDSLLAKIKSLEMRLTRKDRVNTEILKKNEQLRKQISTWEKRYNKQTVKISDLNARLEELEFENDSFVENQNQQQEEIEQLEETIGEFEQQIA